MGCDGLLLMEPEIEFTDAQITRWRQQVLEQRERLFRRNWKNCRPKVGLQSKFEEEAFQFIVEWCEEFDEVVGREKERDRLDGLIAQGLDVNAPEYNPKLAAKVAAAAAATAE